MSWLKGVTQGVGSGDGMSIYEILRLLEKIL